MSRPSCDRRQHPTEFCLSVLFLFCASPRAPTAEDSFIQWVSRQQSGQRSRAFHDIEPGVPIHGWQFFVARAIQEHFVSFSIVPRLSPSESALLYWSLGGPPVVLGACLLFCSVLPRVRRLWLPPSTRHFWGHHRAACSRAGVFGSRGFALESAAARVCRANLFLRDFDVPVPVTDSRRLDVVCNGLLLFRGAQLALDTTLVSRVFQRVQCCEEAHSFLSHGESKGAGSSPHPAAQVVVDALVRVPVYSPCPFWTVVPLVWF